MSEITPYISILAQVSIPGSVALIFYFLWRARVLEVIALKIQGNKNSIENKYNQVNVSTNHDRLQRLEDFKFEAENNHWHEIDDIQAWRVVIDARLNKMAEDLAFIRGKLE
jgi:hypothetical protein